MYTHKRYTSVVRDSASRYGHGPIPAEEHPGARVLRDLRHAPTPEIPLILARYTALRAWSLRGGAAGARLADQGAVSKHAVSAAMAHLDATAEEWPEAHLLGDALAQPDGKEALSLLASAAAAADALGHVHGARALREAVYRERWNAGRYPPPSAS